MNQRLVPGHGVDVEEPEVSQSAAAHSSVNNQT